MDIITNNNHFRTSHDEQELDLSQKVVEYVLRHRALQEDPIELDVIDCSMLPSL